MGARAEIAGFASSASTPAPARSLVSVSPGLTTRTRTDSVWAGLELPWSSAGGLGEG